MKNNRAMGLWYKKQQKTIFRMKNNTAKESLVQETTEKRAFRMKNNRVKGFLYQKTNGTKSIA